MGIVYLIQPAQNKGTQTYKIGCSSKSDESRIRSGYHKDTRRIYVYYTEHYREMELDVKLVFNDKFKLICGSEYFEGDEKDMRKAFMEIMMKYDDITVIPPVEEECEEECKEKSDEEPVSEESKHSGEIAYVQSHRRFDLNPFTNNYEKRHIIGEDVYLVSVPKCNWNSKSRQLINKWLREHNIMDSKFAFGTISHIKDLSPHIILENECEFCGKKCKSLDNKKRHMKICKYKPYL